MARCHHLRCHVSLITATADPDTTCLIIIIQLCTLDSNDEIKTKPRLFDRFCISTTPIINIYLYL